MYSRSRYQNSTKCWSQVQAWGDTPIYIGYTGMCRWKGMVFKPFTLEQGLVIMGKWSRIASRLMIYLMFKTALSWINMEDIINT